MKDITPSFEISDKIYYFSITAGLRNKLRISDRYQLKEPTKLAVRPAGYDLDVDQHLKFTFDAKKPL